jgi:uncharacterized membrane protein YhhN
MSSAALNISVFTCGALAISSWYLKRRALFLFFKPLAAAPIVLRALQKQNSNALYRRAVLIGFLFSLLGDVFLMFPADRPFLCGLVSFLIAYLYDFCSELMRLPTSQRYL